jgi:hypothetical protein
MGALADGFAAYAQPLLEQTDGSEEQLNKAMAISQLCWNMALLPEDSRDQTLSEMRPTLQMDKAEFDEFRRSVIDPMVRRHQEMFPLLHRRSSTTASPGGHWPQARPKASAGEGYPGTEPYAPCPCNSGRKYKFCCRRKGR